MKFLFQIFNSKKPKFHMARSCQARAMPEIGATAHSALWERVRTLEKCAAAIDWLACLFQAGTHPAQTLAHSLLFTKGPAP
ncbi:MAG: hypothetical protein RR311_04540 [Comamonas sp.]